MTCAHHVGNAAAAATPPLALALAAVHVIDVVGVLELLSESLCVVEYRLKGCVSADCICAAPGAPGEPAGVPTAAAAASAALGGSAGVRRRRQLRGRIHVRNPGQRKRPKLPLATRCPQPSDL